MDLDSLSKLGEFVGGFFVVLSLFYLAYQVRQNTKSMMSENYARLLQHMSNMQSRLSVDAELNHIFMVGAEDPGRLSRADRIRFAWALYELFGTAEFMYHQSLGKALPPGVWARWEATIGWWLSHPGIRAWWASKPTPLTADFEAFGEELQRNNRFDPAGVERWRRFVAGDGMSSPPAKTTGASA